MRIVDVLSQDCIIPELKAREKRDLLEEMVNDVASRVDGLDRERLLEVLLEREKLGSTGIGYGVAIPHGKLRGLNRIIVSFGRSLKGVEFQSLDKRPAHLFFLIVAPEDSTVAHLKILARISSLLKDATLRNRLLVAPSREEIYRIIAEGDERNSKYSNLAT